MLTASSKIPHEILWGRYLYSIFSYDRFLKKSPQLVASENGKKMTLFENVYRIFAFAFKRSRIFRNVAYPYAVHLESFLQVGLQTKKRSQQVALQKCNSSTPLGPSLMPLHQWFFIFNCSHRRRLRCALDLTPILYNKFSPLSSGFSKVRCGSFSAPRY